LYVYDVRSGKLLFRTRMPVPVQGFPITYAVAGKQYLAIPVGTGGYIGEGTGSATATSPNAMYVFTLPERAR
jgi:alcohol dehydrogenase (cytochrome c)